MKDFDIPRLRLYNQQITQGIIKNPADVVKWLGAVQAQDYLGSLWAIGLRTQHGTERDIEQAIIDKTIIRTWPMRGTLHFVPALDIVWMLELLAPRIIAKSAYRNKQLELNDNIFKKCRKLFIKALRGNKQLSRDALYQVLENAHIATRYQRGLHILWRLAQERLICFGPRKERKQTFVLLSEWIPQAKTMDHDKSLCEITMRYFKSHGPAQLQDFVWWSGLKTMDALTGVELAKPHILKEVVDGKTYWFASSLQTAKHTAEVYLLPGYDEFLVGYKERSAVLDYLYVKNTNAGGGMLNPTIVIDGRIEGTWKRSFKKNEVVISLDPFTVFTASQNDAIKIAAQRYGNFLTWSVSIL